MGSLCTYSIISTFFLLPPLLLYLLINDLVLPVPPLNKMEPRWWGEGDGGDDDISLKPFAFSATTDQLEDLEKRIKSDLSRLAPALEDSAFSYGFHSEELVHLADYWLREFDWKSEEKVLNSLPQFTTEISGLKVHFIRAVPQPRKNQIVLPLLIVHGWPGSVVEFLDIIPLLVQGNEKVAFEVIAPSIPGYAFSSAPTKMGFNAKEAAVVFNTLMKRLGHKKFIAQGGDWGSFITANLATLFPENLVGLHLNLPPMLSDGGSLRQFVASIPGLGRLLVDEEDLHLVSSFGGQLGKLLQETGYFHIQATKPDTVGVGLSSSPLGLAAYIVEKFSTWTHPSLVDAKDGGLSHLRISKSRIMANVMIYWLTNSITSSVRFYKENAPQILGADKPISGSPLSLPVGFAAFPNELFKVPRTCLLGKFPNLVQYTRMPRGGHFGAMEEPEMMAGDILSFAGKALEDIRRKEEL